MQVYFISGLGADKRAFKKIVLPKNFSIKHIEWVDHSAQESLQDYCSRLSQQIDATQPFALAGLSFGGIVAIELSKILTPNITIIISSISTMQELPMGSVGNILIRKMKFFNIIPSSFFKKANRLTYWLFGVKNKEEKKLLKEIIHDTDPKFAKWAFGKILTWANRTRPQNLLHIHGTADRIFPCSKTLADIKIKGGGHFMIYNKADQISSILSEKLGSN